MGNNQSTEIHYSIENFISDLNPKDIHNIPDSDVKDSLENLLSLFKADKDFYSKYKQEEDSIREMNKHKLKKGNEEPDEGIDKEVTEDDPKSTRFCNIITFIIKLSFQKEYFHNYLLVMEIMTYLYNENEFLKFFLLNTSEPLCNMITANSNYTKLFYQTSIKLLIDVMNILIKDTKLIFTNLSGLRKIIIIPKKLLDPIFIKDSEIKFNLIMLMRNNLLFMKDLYDEAVKDKSNMKNKELIDFVQNTIMEFYNTSVIYKLSDDLNKKENNAEIEKMIVESFNFLAQMDFVISNQYLRCEKEVKNLFTVSGKSKNEEIVEESLKFLINFHINSFKTECDSNFKLFQYEDSDIEDKLFSLFENPDSSDHIKFLICVLFLTVSIKEKIWAKLKSLNMIKPTIRFILSFISSTFASDKFSESDPESELRLNKINIIIKIFSFISDDKSYRKIIHIDFFKFYFDIVLLLFYIFHSSFRIQILHIMNIFTYYYECKKRFLDVGSGGSNSNSVILLHKRLEDLFITLRRLYKMFTDLYDDKNKLMQKKDEVDLIEIKNKYQDNISLLEDLSLNTKNVFFKTAQEFGLLMSIFVNLMLNHDYNAYIRKLVPDKNFFRERGGSYRETNPNIPKKENNNITENNIECKRDRGGTLIQFEEFFRGITLFKNDLRNYQGPYGNLNKYIQQITIARLINFPLGQMEIEHNNNSDNPNEDEVLSNDLNSLYEMMKSYSSEYDVLHKIIYAINRSLQFVGRLGAALEVVKKIIEEIKLILYNNFVSSVIVNRECLRLLCTCTMYSDNTVLWLKFDSRKVHVDYSNQTDVLLKYKDADTDWNPNDEDKERIIFPPYLKVKSYADKMGVIIFGDHVIVLPKRLKLGQNFSIWFRFYNPVISTEKWHVLLQDPSGIGALICIDATKRRLGLFTLDGEFIDSGIDLNDSDLKKKWIQVAMCFRGRIDTDLNEQSRLDWYINGQFKKSYSNDKIVIPKYIQYVGNSRDYSEPFGVFCDVRVYRNFLMPNNISNMYLGEEAKRNEKRETDLLNYIYYRVLDQIINNFLKSDDISEETFYFSIKLFNNIMANRLHRNKFMNYELIMKVNNYFGSRITETKKDVAKFLQTIA